MNLLQTLFRGGWLRSVDFGLAESMQRHRAETPELVLCAAALASRALANGHSQLPLAQVDELLSEIAGDRELPTLPALEEWLLPLRSSPWVASPPVGAASAAMPLTKGIAAEAAPTLLVIEDDAISLRRYWQYEVRLAAALAARLAAPPPIHDSEFSARIAELFPSAKDLTDNAQALAARAALSTRLLLLTGGPGTGKTTTVARTMLLFAEQFSARGTAGPPRIQLAAPTGKAAARLAESVRENLQQLLADGTISAETASSLPGEAKTLHRLLGWQRRTIEYRYGSAHPLPADLVIVDEASMIDLPLMCKLLEAVPTSATLILIGDRDQLPSVETGDVLAALCDAAMDSADVGAALAAMPEQAPQLELSFAAEAAPTILKHGGRLSAFRVHLTHSHRQAEDVEVTALAKLVRDGNDEAAINGLGNQRFRGINWRQGNDRALADAVLAQALPAYAALQAAADVQAALNAARQFRVLTAVREGGAGSQTLNALIASALDPARRGDGFFPGRLVLINENSYRHQLFNGDIGVVWADEFGELRVWFDADGGPRAWLPAALPAHESAFALTVHKSQGSEFERVFFALPEHGARVISRELIYTGLTRCRREVTLWAGEQVLRDGISRKAQRWSGLAKRL
jgi:exodeoxyribonuclease V alpha subunit